MIQTKTKDAIGSTHGQTISVMRFRENGLQDFFKALYSEEPHTTLHFPVCK